MHQHRRAGQRLGFVAQQAQGLGQQHDGARTRLLRLHVDRQQLGRSRPPRRAAATGRAPRLQPVRSCSQCSSCTGAAPAAAGRAPGASAPAPAFGAHLQRRAVPARRAAQQLARSAGSSVGTGRVAVGCHPPAALVLVGRVSLVARASSGSGGAGTRHSWMLAPGASSTTTARPPPAHAAPPARAPAARARSCRPASQASGATGDRLLLRRRQALPGRQRRWVVAADALREDAGSRACSPSRANRPARSTRRCSRCIVSRVMSCWRQWLSSSRVSSRDSPGLRLGWRRAAAAAASVVSTSAAAPSRPRRSPLQRGELRLDLGDQPQRQRDRRRAGARQRQYSRAAARSAPRHRPVQPGPAAAPACPDAPRRFARPPSICCHSSAAWSPAHAAPGAAVDGRPDRPAPPPVVGRIRAARAGLAPVLPQRRLDPLAHHPPARRRGAWSADRRSIDALAAGKRSSSLLEQAAQPVAPAGATSSISLPVVRLQRLPLLLDRRAGRPSPCRSRQQRCGLQIASLRPQPTSSVSIASIASTGTGRGWVTKPRPGAPVVVAQLGQQPQQQLVAQMAAQLGPVGARSARPKAANSPPAAACPRARRRQPLLARR